MGAKSAIGLGLLALVGSGVYVILQTSQDGGEARRVAGRDRSVAVTRTSVVPVQIPAPPEGTRDGASIDGHLIVATPAGLRSPGDAHVTRFGQAELSTMTLQGDALVLGAMDGTITIVNGRDAEQLRFPGAGAVTDLAAIGGRLYVGTEGGLIVWDGERATSVAGVGQVTAMAAGSDGVAIGTETGDVWLASEGRLERMPARLDARVTALAWDGDTLLCGTPFALSRIAGTHVTKVRNDLNVTAILVEGTRIYVGTFDDGVVRLEGDGREHRLVGREHVRRLRWIGGRPVAFGDGGAWDLSGPAASRLV